MQEATCNQCGASTILSAKFCRQCGNHLDASEMTTRSLDAPSAQPPTYDHPTRPANAAITAPTYAPHSAMSPPPPAPIIGNAPPVNNKMALLVFLALGLTVLIALGVVAFVVLERGFGRQPVVPPPPPITEKAPPPLPPPGVPGTMPPVPAVPPAPPAEPGTRTVTFPFDASFMYPGAQTVMSVNSSNQRVAQLRTSDPFNKVAEWYKDRIKATEEVNMPGSLVLTGKDMKVILSGDGAGTVITLTNDRD
jgi:hypothetical protein